MSLVESITEFFSKWANNLWSIFGNIHLQDLYNWLPSDIFSVIDIVIALIIGLWFIKLIASLLLRG